MGRSGFLSACKVGWKEEGEKPLFPRVFSVALKSKCLSDWVPDPSTEEKAAEGVISEAGVENKPLEASN